MSVRRQTFDANGQANGYLILGWNAIEEPQQRPEQIYHTVLVPRAVKGPHLHMVRCGRFQCVSGNVRIVVRTPDGRYKTFFSGEDHGFAIVKVEPGCPAALYNDDGNWDAVVANMPSPAWAPDAQDEHPVEDWNP